MIEDKKIFDLIIVGAGPAGMTAAIYAARSNLKVLIIEKEVPGGKMVTTNLIENYPGFESISGPDLSWNMYQQCINLKVEFQFDEVIDISTQSNNFKKVITKQGNIFESKAIIIATGMINRKLNIPNEDKLFHKGISYCAICDGAFFKGQDVAVIGSGRSATEESIFLSDIVNKVYLISNKPQLKTDEIILDKIKTIKNIEILYNTNTLSFNGENNLESITIEQEGKQTNLKVQGAFIFIGFLPLSPTVENKQILDQEFRFIKADEKMQTKFSGIFSAGDVNIKNFRQISTAISDGTVAALSAIEYISLNNWNYENK